MIVERVKIADVAYFVTKKRAEFYVRSGHRRPRAPAADAGTGAPAVDGAGGLDEPALESRTGPISTRVIFDACSGGLEPTAQRSATLSCRRMREMRAMTGRLSWSTLTCTVCVARLGRFW